MAVYARRYICSCDLCQRTKTFPAKPQGELTPNEVPACPWQVISTDLITQLPDSQGYDSVLVVVDRFSKMMHISKTTLLPSKRHPGMSYETPTTTCHHEGC